MMAEYREILLKEYKDHVYLIHDLGINSIIKERYPFLEISLKKDGVLLKGNESDIRKAHGDLAETISKVKEQHGWHLDGYKKQLLQLRGTQQYVVAQLKEQCIKCHLPFTDKTALDKIYTLSLNEASKAEAVVDECIQVLRLPVNDLFLESTFGDISFNYPEKIIQLDEGNEAVLVFTKDVAAAVKAARATADDTEVTGVDEKYESVQDSAGDNVRLKSVEDEKSRQTHTGEASEDSEEVYHSLDEENSSMSNYFEADDSGINSSKSSSGGTHKTRNDSYGDITMELVDMDINVANYLNIHCRSRLEQLEEKYEISIYFNNGLEISGELNPEKKQNIFTKLRLLGKSVVYCDDYFDGLESLRYFQHENEVTKRQYLSRKGQEVTVIPWEGGSVQEVDTVHYSGIDVKIVLGSVIDLKSAGMVVCPLSESLQPLSAMAKQIVSAGGDELKRKLIDDLKSYLRNMRIGKFEIGQVNFASWKDSNQFVKFAGIVFGSDWFTNIPASEVLETENKIVKRMKHILEEAENVGLTSTAVPLEVGGKIPATVMARICCQAIKGLCQAKRDRVHLQTVYLCVIDEQHTHSMGRVVREHLLGVGNTGAAVRTMQVRTKVQVIVDTLVKQKVDAIVVPVSSDLKLHKGNVSKTVLVNAGNEIQTELSKNYPQGLGPTEIVKSSSGKLPCKLILYGCLPTDQSYSQIQCYKLFMKNCYEAAARYKLTSLAFPAIGAGGMGYNPHIVAKEMFRAAHLYAGPCGVRTVNFVMYHRDEKIRQAFEHIWKLYQDTLKRIHDVESQSREYIEIQVKGFDGKVQILDSDHENNLSDTIICQGLPKKRLDTDEQGTHFNCLIRTMKQEGCLVKHVIFLCEHEDRFFTDNLRQQYRKALEYVIVDSHSQIITVDFTTCNMYDTMRAVMDVLKILSEILTKKNLVKKINIIVPPECMNEKLLKHARQEEQDKVQNAAGKNILTQVSSRISKALTPSPLFTWKVICQRGRSRMGSGVSVVVCADSSHYTSRNVKDLLDDFRQHIGHPSEASKENEFVYRQEDEQRPPLHPRTKAKGEAGRRLTPEPPQEDDMPEPPQQNYMEIYGNITSKLSEDITQRFSMQELRNMCTMISDIETVSAVIDQDGIEIRMDYSRRYEVENLLQTLFAEVDIKNFFVRNISENMYTLLYLHFTEHEPTDYISKLCYSEEFAELEIFDENVHTVVLSKLKTLKTYSMDAVDASSVTAQKIKDALATMKNDHPDVLLRKNGQQIELYGPSENLGKAKYRLNVLLGHIVTRTRGERQFDDFLSLQSTMHEPAQSDLSPTSVSIKSSDSRRSAFMRSQSLDNSAGSSTKQTKSPVTSPTAKLTQYNFKNTARGNRTDSNSKPDDSGMSFKTVIGSLKLRVHQGNILNQPVDCIVNAANAQLQHGGGVAGFIAKAAGPELEQESADWIKKWDSLEVTKCMVTTAGKLPYKHVVHAVGPRGCDYRDDQDGLEDDLKTTIANCLLIAERNRHKSVAIPSISAGIFGVPEKICAEQYGRGVAEFTENSNNILEEVHFVDLNKNMIATIQSVFSQMFIVESSEQQASQVEDNSVIMDSCAEQFSIEESTMSSRNSTCYRNENKGKMQGAKSLVTKDMETMRYADESFASQGQGTFREDSVADRFSRSDRETKKQESMSRHSMPASVDQQHITGRKHGESEWKTPPGQSLRSSNKTYNSRNTRDESVEDVSVHKQGTVRESGVKTGSEVIESLSYREKQSLDRSVCSQEVMPSMPSIKDTKETVESLSYRGRVPGEHGVDEPDMGSTVGDLHNPYTFTVSNCRLLVYSADISRLNVDAVVSTEDNECTGAGRIAKSIKSACGQGYWDNEHSKLKNRKLKITEAFATRGGQSTAYRWVIHTIAPRWRHSAKKKFSHFKEEMQTTLRDIFGVVAENPAKSVGIPLLGYVGDDAQGCCETFVDAVVDCFADRSRFPSHLKEVHLVGYSDDIATILVRYARQQLEVSSKHKSVKGKGRTSAQWV